MGRGTAVAVADKKHNAGAQPLDPWAMVGAGVEPRKGGMVVSVTDQKRMTNK
jgi:hypothetical protein